MLQVLKCANENCCKPRRSSIFKFLHPTGLPPPIPIQQTKDGLKIAELKDIDKYADLFVTLSISEAEKLKMLPEISTKKVVYDSFCPSVQDKIIGRVCVCGRYFSSVSSMKSHLKANFSCKKSVPPVKPVKLLGQRKDEKLVLVQYDTEEDIEWVYDLDLESEEEFVEKVQPENEHFSIEKVLTPVWKEDKQ